MKQTIFNVDEGKMQKYYSDLMDQVYLQYHRHPTHLIGNGENHQEVLGNGQSLGVGNSGSKKVVVHGVKGMSNGMPDTKFNGGKR